MTREQQESVDHLLGAVKGEVFTSNEGGVIVLLNSDNYAISVAPDGDTSSAYLVTVHPSEIAEAMHGDEREISGWETGYDI